MTINDLTSEDKKMFNEVFNSNKEIRALKDKLEYHRRHNQYIQALQVGQTLDALKLKVFNIWINEVQESAEKIDMKDVDMPQEHRDLINILSITAFMACDIIESCVMDMNDTLHKTHPDMTVEMFDNLTKMAEEAKEHLEFLRRNSTVLKDIMWGDKCDDMYKMMQNKAKAIIKNNIKLHKHESDN